MCVVVVGCILVVGYFGIGYGVGRVVCGGDYVVGCYVVFYLGY